MFINTWNQKKHSISRFGFAIVAGVMMLAGFHQGAFAAEGSQKSFKSPEDAVKALTEAVKGDDTKDTPMTERMTKGVLQPDGSTRVEPRMDVQAVANAIVYMDSLPLDANVQFMTVMATKMPFVGRG